jgi:hypothetical protein
MAEAKDLTWFRLSAARVSYSVVGAQTANERSPGLPFGGRGVRWLLTGKGI